jgi:hypothetical protein
MEQPTTVNSMTITMAQLTSGVSRANDLLLAITHMFYLNTVTAHPQHLNSLKHIREVRSPHSSRTASEPIRRHSARGAARLTQGHAPRALCRSDSFERTGTDHALRSEPISLSAQGD